MSGEEKRCTRCGSTKSLTDFPLRGGKESGYRSYCKACKNTAAMAYKRAHAESTNASNSTYRETHKQELRETSRQWRKNNPERVLEIVHKYRTTHAAEYKAYRAAYTKAHTPHRNVLQHNYRAQHVGAQGTHTVQEWEDLKAKYGGRCLFCGRTNRPLTKDHVIPFQNGGTNDIGNIQPLCQPCNASKGKRSIDFR